MEWCDEGIYLLASQPVDKFQSQDGAESALQEIERFLESCTENIIKDLPTVLAQYEAILTAELKVDSKKLWILADSVCYSRNSGSVIEFCTTGACQ